MVQGCGLCVVIEKTKIIDLSDLTTMNRLSADFISEFSALMEMSFKMSANEFYQSGMNILKKHKLIRE